MGSLWIQLDPDWLVESRYELAFGPRSYHRFPDTDIENIVSALRLDQVNFRRNIAGLVASFDQHSLGSHTQRNLFVPDCGYVTMYVTAKTEDRLHPVQANVSRRIRWFNAAIDDIHDRAADKLSNEQVSGP